ncbi:glycoside hydrolase family 3 N-terminal domain-containing protein [Cellulomonas sp. URHD0024]|uniref:glycoside hydrolase family 3 N-terminal domain-containing protein n=1 Tax=Cellulomonas sp. URHD0024 TaxID=1302620 RepID=UPI000483C0DC|nr:glycoside hydrolase family 3 N-terminal domain-containing protein [Cellulomonas sp. URHD0024]
MVPVLLLCLLAGCTASPGPTTTTSAPAPTTGSPDPATTTSAPGPTTTAEPDPLAGWTIEEKVGQIVMVGVNLAHPQPASISSVTDQHVGNVFLQNRSSAGTQSVLDLVHQLTDQPTSHGTPLFVGVDQEGGQVQSLTGPGFSTIPSALDQGAMSPADLSRSATTWGAELAAAGVNLNLAPVADVPSEAAAAQNAPIGHYERAFGYSLDTVGPHADAFAEGMAASGVETAVKHFPGLGAVTANPDTAANVTDTTTGPGSVQIESFTHAILRGTRMIMVSTAIYTQIDASAPAAFSPVVVDQLLRKTLGFDGVVITDDLSAAAQVAAWSPGDRAVDAISAGCDIVLASKDPTVLPEMVGALTTKAESDPAFAALVDAAVLRVLAARSGRP